MILDIIATLVAVAAGVYLLTSKTAAPDSYLQVIAHGIGAYMIAKGLFIARSTFLQAEALKELRRVAGPENDK